MYDHMKEKVQRKKTTLKKDGAKDNTKDVQGIRPKTNGKYLSKKHCFNCGSIEHDAKNCTNANKGPKCFKCNDYGYIASKCPQVKPQETQVSTVNCVKSIDDKFILVDIAGLKCRTLIDTGSDVSLLRNNWYEKIGGPKLNSTTRTFTGLGSAITKPSAAFLLKIIIENDAYEVEVYVVPVKVTDTELILGCNFLKQAEVIIREGRTEVKRLAAKEDFEAVHDEPAIDES